MELTRPFLTALTLCCALLAPHAAHAFAQLRPEGLALLRATLRSAVSQPE